jgi:hypothetical protein
VVSIDAWVYGFENLSLTQHTTVPRPSGRLQLDVQKRTLVHRLGNRTAFNGSVDVHSNSLSASSIAASKRNPRTLNVVDTLNVLQRIIWW